MIEETFIKVRRGPDGIHLFERKSGTNILLDEHIPQPSSWTTCPRQISIALTNACDLSCTHCYAPKHIASLPKKLVKQWMLELDNAGCFGVGFGGGEPTLHPDLVDLCKFGQQETGLAISLTTHGHTLSDKLVLQLQHTVNFMRVSMDGIGLNYESIRGRFFEELKRNLALLTGRIPFGINCIINNKTIGDLSAVVQVAEACGAAELLLLPEEPIGFGKQIDAATLERLCAWVANYKGNVRLSISINYKDMVDNLCALENESNNLAFAHIDANGVLKRTSFDKSGSEIGGDGILMAFSKLNSKRKIHEDLAKLRG